MRPGAPITVTPNNELERTRSAQQTDYRGPRRSIQCCAYGGAVRAVTAVILLLAACTSAEAQPRPPVTAVTRPFANAPVKGDRALQTWALAASEPQPMSVIKELQILLADPDKEVQLAAAWAIGHLRVKETGEEAPAYDEAPKLARQTKPVYPVDAFIGKIQGVVRVEFVIDEAGRVAHAEVRESIGPLDRAAVACVKEWRFTPGRLAGRAVPVLAAAPVSFKIDK